MRGFRVTSRTAAAVASIAVLLAPSLPASAATESIRWRLTGNGYCVVNTLRPMSPLPATSGELLEWSASSSVCGDKPVAGVMLRATVLFPPECRFHHPGEQLSRYYTGGEASETYADPQTTGAVTYFEMGDGTIPPHGSIGTIEGAVPQPVPVSCWFIPGWQFRLKSYVLAPDSRAWITVGSSAHPFKILGHPSFDLERHVLAGSDEHVDGRHCADFSFRLYDTDNRLVVGDLMEWAAVMKLCDTTDAPLNYGHLELVSPKPPPDCLAPRWMYPRFGSESSLSAGESSHSGGAFVAQYGDYGDDDAHPPDIDPLGFPGRRTHVAWVVPNCPGTWTFKVKLSVDEIDNVFTGDWREVGPLLQEVVVFPS